MSPLYNVGDIVQFRPEMRTGFIERKYGDSCGVVIEVQQYRTSGLPADYRIRFDSIDEGEYKEVIIDERYIGLYSEDDEEEIQPNELESLFD